MCKRDNEHLKPCGIQSTRLRIIINEKVKWSTVIYCAQSVIPEQHTDFRQSLTQVDTTGSMNGQFTPLLTCYDIIHVERRL